MTKSEIALKRIITYIKEEGVSNCGLWEEDEDGFNFGNLLDDIKDLANRGLECSCKKGK